MTSSRSACKKIFAISLMILLLALLNFAHAAARTGKAALVSSLKKMTAALNGKVGIAVSGLDFEDTILLNDEISYPMQSVYKFPLAIYILHLAEKGALRLDSNIIVRKSALIQDTWSPMLKDFPADNINITIAGLLRYSVSKSDNNACDLLFDLAGGTQKVNAYFHASGIPDISIAATEAEMHATWQAQYTNGCKPSAMLHLLHLFYRGELLQPSGNAFLMTLMKESENSVKRIKGRLPEYAIVAHKTGTGNMNDNSVIAATNDVGIITLPDGRHYAIVVYVSDYTGGYEKGEKLIADVSKAIFDYYAQDYTAESKHVTLNIVDLYDTSRKRRIEVAAYQPAKTAKRNNKVAILNHGYDPANEQAYLSYSYIANFLAAQGYLVLSIQHGLSTDSPIPREGNLQLLRMPFWEAGVRNIVFVADKLKERFPAHDFDKLTLIGHSNGGDIAALFTTHYPEKVERLITLDNRRVALPRTSYPHIYSLRSADLPADAGVLPDAAQQAKYNMTIVNLQGINHNDMDNDGTATQRKTITDYIRRFIK